MALNRILVKLAQKLILKYLQVRYPAGANRYEDVADTWFLERVSFIPYHMCRAIKPYTALTGRALDFGCGEGIMALGMRLQNPELEVVGVDLHDASKYLLGLTQRNLGLSALPGNLSFHQIADDEELSRLVGREFSTVYSWSVFEHVSRRHLPKETLKKSASR